MTAESSGSRSRRKLAWPLAICVLAGGATLRLVHLTDPPLDFHPNRQYHSALLARGLYADHATEWSDARRALAHEAMPHLIEPPLMESAAAWMYRAVGFEALWIPRLLSIAAWTLGGLSLYRLASRWLSPSPVLVCLAIYAYLPFGIVASRAFQPDPLMIALVIAAVERTAAWQTSHRRSIALAALALGTAAVFVKPMAILLLAPVYCAIALAAKPRTLRALAALPAALLCIAIPSTIYFATTMVQRGELDDYTQWAAALELFTLREFWVGWSQMFLGAVTPALVPCVLLLAVPIRARSARLVLIGGWSGYLLLALAFPYHIYTHSYYSLVAIPLIALSTAYAVEVLNERLSPLTEERLQWLAIGILAAAVSAGVLSVVRVDTSSIVAMRDRLEELDRRLPERARLIVLDDSYGKSILFHAARRVSVWPLSMELHARAIQGLAVQRFDELAAAASGADYFVVTAANDLVAQPQLRERLASLPQVPSALAAPAAAVQVYDLRTAVAPTITPVAANFAFMRDGRFRTPPQKLQVQIGGFEPREWSFALPPEAPITITPSRGVGNAEVTVDVRPTAATGAVAVTLSARGAPSSQLAIRWATIDGISQAPIGNLEAPAVDAGAGALRFGGWAMDDLGVRRVILVGVDANGGERELAATDAFGVRPDLQQAFASWPGAGRGAWLVTLDRAAIHDLAFVRVDAEDVEGQRATIGRRARGRSGGDPESMALRVRAKRRPAA